MQQKTIVIPFFVVLILKLIYLILPLDWIGFQFQMPKTKTLLAAILIQFFFMATVYAIRVLFWLLIIFYHN